MTAKHKLWVGLASVAAAIAVMWRKRTVRFSVEIEPQHDDHRREAH